MYTLYKFHFLNGISEINQLFDDILIIWPAPVCVREEQGGITEEYDTIINHRRWQTPGHEDNGRLLLSFLRGQCDAVSRQ